MGLATDIIKAVLVNVINFVLWITGSFALRLTTEVMLMLTKNMSGTINIDINTLTQMLSQMPWYGKLWLSEPLIVGIASFIWLIARQRQTTQYQYQQYGGW